VGHVGHEGAEAQNGRGGPRARPAGAGADVSSHAVATTRFHPDAVEATKAVHRRYARDRPELEAGDVPGSTTPFVIDYPENWERAPGVVHQHWGHFFHHGFTPAEVVDYWTNVRQARAKLPQDLPL
jgi:hypothetical protein